MQDLLAYMGAAIAVWAASEELGSVTLRLSRHIIRVTATGLSERRRPDRLRDWLAELEHFGPVSRIIFALGLWFSFRLAPTARSEFAQVAITLQFAVKRGLDGTFALCLLAAYWPILLLIALAVVIDSRGPVFVRSKCVGRAGRQIEILRFRTMHKDAQKGLRALLTADGAAEEYGHHGTAKRDPRITRVGKLLRRLSLDVVPEFLSIIRGDLSFIGPRPHPLGMGPREREAWFRNERIRPGMTGLWQTQIGITGGWERNIELDLYYAQNWSLALDCTIAVATVRAFFTDLPTDRARGA